MVRNWRFSVWVYLLLGCVAWGLSLIRPTYAYHSDLPDGGMQFSGEDAQQAITLPQNFIARTVVSRLRLPTDMVVLPWGDILVTEKGVGGGVVSKAQVRLVRDGILQLQPVLTLGVNSEVDSGLMSIVLDPDFVDNGYFYLWYATGEDALGWDGTSYNRLSRFTFDRTTGTASLASETIILDKVPWAKIHNGGGLAFDDQGNLLIATGDAGSDYNSPATHLAQSLKSLNGKLLRIRPNLEGGYSIPFDNPYLWNTQGYLPEIYASGLRNPFRVARRAADQSFYVIDVGEATWEEINRAAPGANYGWPYREGRCPIYRSINCSATPAEFTDPVLAYLHPENGAGATALTFYEGTAWPEQYQGLVFLADFNSQWVGTANLDAPEPVVLRFAGETNGLVDMEATAKGIYLLSIVEGSIRFVYYDPSSNHPPSVQWKVTPANGAAPLEVVLSATATDEDNDALTYLWNFGDGSLTSTTVPTATHVYTQDGDYLATLQVSDRADGVGRSEILSQLVQVYSGARATIATENLTENGRSLYRGGDRFRFRAAREGGTVGLDPTTPYAWTVLLHHNEHAHILTAEFASEELLIDVPVEAHAVDSALWYEIQLLMHTDQGQTLVASRSLRPQTTRISAQSWPAPTTITMNQQVLQPDDTILLIVGQEYVLEANESVVYDQKVGEFSHWVVTSIWPEGNTTQEAVIVPDRVYTLTAPIESNSYVAFYEYVRPASRNYIPTVRR